MWLPHFIFVKWVCHQSTYAASLKLNKSNKKALLVTKQKRIPNAAARSPWPGAIPEVAVHSDFRPRPVNISLSLPDRVLNFQLEKDSPMTGIEPVTNGSGGWCSTDWAIYIWRENVNKAYIGYCNGSLLLPGWLNTIWQAELISILPFILFPDCILWTAL